jgi:hypothetical protein
LVDGEDKFKAKDKDSGIPDLHLDAMPVHDYFADEVRSLSWRPTPAPLP